MHPEESRVQTNAGNPLADQSGVLSCRNRSIPPAGAGLYFKALRWVAENPAGAETALNKAIDRTNTLRRMLADVRVGLAKHQMQGSNTDTPHPGYGRISPLNGSISWRVMYEEDNFESLISRRDLADECRAMLNNLPI